MMYGWSFHVPTVSDFARLLRALGKHRYLGAVEHSVHYAIDAALSDLEGFAEHHARFEAMRREDGSLDLSSRDPRLWREASAEEIGDAVALLWSDAPYAGRARHRLSETLRDAGIASMGHEAFQADPDDGAHPELLRLDWSLLRPDELDTERHAGAFRAMERHEEEVEPSRVPLIEAMLLAEPELTSGQVPTEVMFWADGPYSYCDYVFRGAAKSAKLPDAPLGYHDIDKL